MAGVGHNSPPSMVEITTETMRDISAWLSENVQITEETAKDAKLFLDRGKLCLKDLDDERDGKVRPLNEKVKSINDSYRPAREDLSSVVGQLNVRLTRYATAERERREAIAHQAAKEAAEAEQRARNAEKAEQELFESADNGELGLDVAASTQAANEAFRDFESAAHKAAIAERDTKVKIGGGFSRAIGLKQKETLIVTAWLTAINEMGATEDIKEAVIKSARAYRKLNGRLPEGVESRFTESI